MLNYKYIVVGAGIYGSVIANRIASVLNEDVLLIEKRDHIGGNCYSRIDEETGIEYHCYGSHIFHTSDESVWKFISQFADFTNYRHKVLAISGGKAYFMPINLKTLSDVYQRAITPAEASDLLAGEGKDAGSAGNLEEKAIALVGKTLYEKFIRGYTAKQWEKSPRDLPPDIISRLPVRTTYSIDYFDDLYQGVPRDGYFRMFEKLLSNPRIHVMLDTGFQSVRGSISPETKIVYTGKIDEYFDYVYGNLEWRSLQFEYETHQVRDYQGTTVVNYTDADIPYTRIHEFKHFHPERRTVFESNRTLICKEYPKTWNKDREAYYPVNTKANQELLERYRMLARQSPNTIFGGRLGCYRYWDMDKAILAALNCFETQIREH